MGLEQKKQESTQRKQEKTDKERKRKKTEKAKDPRKTCNLRTQLKSGIADNWIYL